MRLTDQHGGQHTNGQVDQEIQRQEYASVIHPPSVVEGRRNDRGDAKERERHPALLSRKRSARMACAIAGARLLRTLQHTRESSKPRLGRTAEKTNSG